MRRHAGFTLIELLVTVAIIGLLVAILLPSLAAAKERARLVACSSNLKQIFVASSTYAMDYEDHFPDPYTLGGFNFRIAPGLRTPNDPSAKPEIYGLASVLAGLNKTGSVAAGIPAGDGMTQTVGPAYMDGRSKAWICPSSTPAAQANLNTYDVSIAAAVSKWKSTDRMTVRSDIWVWDNTVFYPYLSGFYGGSGSTTGYAIPVAQRARAHLVGGKAVVNYLQINGDVMVR